MGQVCAKHNQFYETECKWCEPAPASLYFWRSGLTLPPPLAVKIQEAMNEAWAMLAAEDLSKSPLDRHDGCE